MKAAGDVGTNNLTLFEDVLAFADTYYITTAIEIGIIAFLIYKLLGVIPRSRGLGLTLIVFALILMNELAELLNLFILQEIFGTISYGILFLIIVFHPEFRRALLGVKPRSSRRRLLMRARPMTSETGLDSLFAALKHFSQHKIGALIALQREDDIESVGYAGLRIDAALTSELIQSIFFPQSPLHDGGMTIEGDQIARVGVSFPSTVRDDIPADVGLRHRAALGLSEEVDALVFVASEETGSLSLMYLGEWKKRSQPSTYVVLPNEFWLQDRWEPYDAWPIFIVV